MTNIEQAMSGYVPASGTEARKLWRTIKPFIKETMGLLTGITAGTVKNYLHAVTHFVAWCLGQGIPLDREMIFTPLRIEQYIETATGHLQPHSRSTRRAILARVARQTTETAPWAPPPRPFPPKHLAKPYASETIARFFAVADQQVTEFRRRVATAHLCLGLGAGLLANEYLNASADDLTVVGGVPVLEIGGERPRTVPLHEKYLQPLCDIASDHPEEPFIGPLSGEPVKDRLNNLLGKVEYPRGLTRPTTTRLRNTWMLRMLRSRVSISEFMYLSGLGTTKSLADLAPYVHWRDSREWFGEVAAYHD